MIRRVLSAMLLTALPLAASATTVTKPYNFTANTLAQSAQVNADLNILYTAINGNIDNTNIGSAGIFASQIIPTTVAQATFGGSQVYTFSNGVSITGPLTLTGNEVQTGNQTTNGTLSVSSSTATLPVISTVAGGATGVLAVNGFSPSATTAFGSTSAGYAISWNASSGQGETDFINGYSSSTNNAFSFLFENTSTSPYTQSTLATLSRAGLLTITSLSASSATLSGTLTAASASISGTVSAQTLSLPSSGTASGGALTFNSAAIGSATFGSVATGGLIATGTTQLNSVTSGCVYANSVGVLSSTGSTCSAPAKYTVTATLTANCAANTGCTAYTTSGLPTGSPSTTGNCSAMESGNNPGAFGYIAYNGAYFLEVQNNNAGAITSGTTITYLVSCQ